MAGLGFKKNAKDAVQVLAGGLLVLTLCVLYVVFARCSFHSMPVGHGVMFISFAVVLHVLLIIV